MAVPIHMSKAYSNVNGNGRGHVDEVSYDQTGPDRDIIQGQG